MCTSINLVHYNIIQEGEGTQLVSNSVDCPLSCIVLLSFKGKTADVISTKKGLLSTNSVADELDF